MLILFQIVVFVCYAVAASKDNNPYNDVTAHSGSPKGSSLTYYPDKRHEVWRFVTYIFIHDGYEHLIINVIFQLLFGCVLEVVHKYWRVGIVFLGGAVGGAFSVVITSPFVGHMGASGGAYALFGAQYAVVLMALFNCLLGVPLGRYSSTTSKDGEVAEDHRLGLYCSSHNSGVDVSDIPQHMWKVRMVSPY
ncbi:unnamed protein product [Hymenolepis diminuta]|uniref:Peptidase S54 rhomboid domain-containing protein n=1 Tax=Hymenolepis diminuta TaxID=6216 RepID=A0A3P7A5D9_HYMDI|nr:unnamed protein product [Hymenolepis diminuta]